MTNCLNCGKELSSESVIDLCERCGIGMYGEKTFSTIVNNLKEDGDRQNLTDQGTLGMEMPEPGLETLEETREFS